MAASKWDHTKHPRDPKTGRFAKGGVVRAPRTDEEKDKARTVKKAIQRAKAKIAKEGYKGPKLTPIPKTPQSPQSHEEKFDKVRQAAAAIKAETGFSAAKISDLIKKSGLTKDEVHDVLQKEASKGNVDLHPATSLNHSQEEKDAAIPRPDSYDKQPAMLATVRQPEQPHQAKN